MQSSRVYTHLQPLSCTRLHKHTLIYRIYDVYLVQFFFTLYSFFLFPSAAARLCLSRSSTNRRTLLIAVNSISREILLSTADENERSEENQFSKRERAYIFGTPLHKLEQIFPSVAGKNGKRLHEFPFHSSVAPILRLSPRPTAQKPIEFPVYVIFHAENSGKNRNRCQK